MTATKVSANVDIEKLKAEKALTAKKCTCVDCENIGKWDDRKLNFYLQKGMCNMHYKRFCKYGEDKVLAIRGENRSKNPLYRTYNDIKERTTNPNNKAFKDYGSRGIRVCDEWLNDFTQFEKDMGQKPSPQHSIERDDVNGNYCKSNCRWATRHEQNANKRNSGQNTGVRFCKKRKMYVADLVVNHVLYRKRFKTEPEAIAYRKELELKYL